MHQDTEGGVSMPCLFRKQCGEFSDWNKDVAFPLESSRNRYSERGDGGHQRTHFFR